MRSLFSLIVLGCLSVSAYGQGYAPQQYAPGSTAVINQQVVQPQQQPMSMPFESQFGYTEEYKQTHTVRPLQQYEGQHYQQQQPYYNQQHQNWVCPPAPQGYQWVYPQQNAYYPQYTQPCVPQNNFTYPRRWGCSF